jgi:DNA-binding NtrC family response regulator
LRQRLERAATLRTPLLLVAEPGCGVELCARLMHQRNTPWVAPENTVLLAEAPLDLLAQARDGTLFLHEIGELSRLEQKGLLLAIGRLDKYNVRLVCATSHALAEAVAQGTFDPRLYSAVSGLTVRVPGLREHREDIPELAALMFARMVEAGESAPRQFSTAALNALRAHDWPGNLAQLESVVKTIALTALSDEISQDDVTRVLGEFDAATPSRYDVTLDLPLREARDVFERVYFEHHIAKEGGNMSRVADRVGLERTHLYRKLKQLGVRLGKKSDE